MTLKGNEDVFITLYTDQLSEEGFLHVVAG